MNSLNNPPAQPVVPRHAAIVILLREAQATVEMLARVHEQRCAIVSQPELFATLLQAEHLRLDVNRLIYWAHWITPSAVPKRFDTRFFIAGLPPEQSAAIDAVEATQMVWMTSASPIAAAHDNTMTPSQPSLYDLTELDSSMRQHVSLNAMLAAEARRDVAPVLPKVGRAALDRDAMGSRISQPRRRRSVARNVLSAASSRSSVASRQRLLTQQNI